MTPDRGKLSRRMTIVGAALVVLVEVLALLGARGSFWSVGTVGQLVVLAGACGMFGLTLAADRGRSPAFHWTLAMAALTVAGATVTFVAGRHRKVDTLLWLAILATSVAALIEARRRRHS